jgi:hypothetical protein
MMNRMRQRPLSAVLLLTAIGLTAAGCASVPTPFACPAIGWVNSLTVELGGETSGVGSVQLCTDDGCAPGDDVDPSGPLGLVTLDEHDGDVWSFSVGMTTPDHITVRVLAADGTVLSETAVEPEWVRVGGDARCGGPSEATVHLSL